MSTPLLDLHSPRLTVPVSDRDHVRGPATASVTLLEYGDYECSYCALAQPVVEMVTRVMGDELRFAFRHFPLSQAHPHAVEAAEAAEAAGVQRRFWDMHDLLFENQDRLDGPSLLAYAAQLQLDIGRFAAELHGHVHAARVREDFLSGVRSGVNGTPTFFVNGVRHNGGHDPDSLLEAVRATSSANLQ
jgi:protein-disulfide isomerase